MATPIANELSTPSGTQRIGSLDAVRGMAILAVIATHSLSATVAVTGSYSIPPPIFRAFDFGQFGVPLFFALSGWLLFALYTGNDNFSQKVYWSRRIARIWPLWIIFVVLSFVAWGIPESGLPTVVSLLISIFFLGWWSSALVAIPLGGLTIQQEVGHYVLFSFLRKRSAAFLAGTVIIGYLSQYLAQAIAAAVSDDSLIEGIAQAWLRLSLFNSWPFFLLGGAGLVIYRRWKSEGVGSVLQASPGTAIVVGLAIMLGLLTTYAQETPGFFVLGYVLVMAALAIVLDSVPVVGPVLQSIGRYSYFMYFFHFFVLRWLEGIYARLALPTGDTSVVWNLCVLAAMFTMSTAASWAVGWISWRILEAPIMRLTRSRVRASTSV